MILKQLLERLEYEVVQGSGIDTERFYYKTD